MDLAKHETLFSKIRLSKYINACSGDIYKGLQLYKYNIQACQALYPIISILEVGLRNSIDRELSKYFADENWLVTKQAQFAEHPDLVYKNVTGEEQQDFFFKEKIKKNSE
jgi:hypothetical protein